MKTMLILLATTLTVGLPLATAGPEDNVVTFIESPINDAAGKACSGNTAGQTCVGQKDDCVGYWTENATGVVQSHTWACTLQ